MAEYDINIDCDRAVAVNSALDSSRKELPKFVQGDTMLLRVFLLKGYNQTSAYEAIPTEGLTLVATLGTRVGNTSTHYAEQAVWTASEDLANPYFEAEFALNTAEVTALLGTSSSKTAYFEIKYYRDGKPTTVLSELVTVYAAVNKPGDLVVPVGLTPLSAEAATAVFLGRTIQGVVRWVSPDGTKEADISYGDDGAWHVDPIT